MKWNSYYKQDFEYYSLYFLCQGTFKNGNPYGLVVSFTDEGRAGRTKSISVRNRDLWTEILVKDVPEEVIEKFNQRQGESRMKDRLSQEQRIIESVRKSVEEIAVLPDIDAITIYPVVVYCDTNEEFSSIRKLIQEERPDDYRLQNYNAETRTLRFNVVADSERQATDSMMAWISQHLAYLDIPESSVKVKAGKKIERTDDDFESWEIEPEELSDGSTAYNVIAISSSGRELLSLATVGEEAAEHLVSVLSETCIGISVS